MVRLDISPENRHLEGTIIPILYSRFSYRDVTSEEELAWYEVYAAKGGFMARWTGFPEGGNPWTIENSVCVPPNEGSISKRYGFTLTN